MIIPIGAHPAYVKALKEEFDRYSKVVRTPEEIAAFCEAFSLGWEKSKLHTYEILNNISNEGNEND